MPVHGMHLPPRRHHSPGGQAAAALTSDVQPGGSGSQGPGLCPAPGRRVRWVAEHAGRRHASLSLFSSQDLKFNSISKEINFKVPFYAV